MKRKSFLINCGVLCTGSSAFGIAPHVLNYAGNQQSSDDPLYILFKNPPPTYRPYVRWWWNGNKVEKKELLRELHLLKEAGIGGVEINPIKFPQRTDDLGKPSLPWLSDGWIDLLDFTLTEAKKLNLTCDLLVGSGWPFGAEYLEGEEQAQIITIGVKKLEGAIDFEAPIFDFLKEADPATTSPYAHRKATVLRVFAVPDPMSSLNEIIDLSEQIPSGLIKVSLPVGKFAIYALVKTHAFLEVINGAPGASGPVLNHYNKEAVEKYLNRMTDTIQKRVGSLKGRVRALFTDSLELEGANWSSDMVQEFKHRRGYDLMPYLPFLLFRIGGMGNVFDYEYGTSFNSRFQNTIDRVRYDFEITKTELLHEHFVEPFQHWCSQHGLKSRVQSYGRGYHPLEGSFDMDIPEGETWVKYGVGKEMPETDYRIGRAYTMVNKYVSSAAHLQGKRLISCEEATNTDRVFNTTLKLLKCGSDQSVMSGITHSIYHGFNYSPKEAPFPGWIRYGNFMNERNTYWPYFKYLNDYRARIAALLQQADMFADIAILPPVYNMWAKYGAQNEPFPSLQHPQYLSLIWEVMHQNGNACDYISDTIIKKATIENGFLRYGTRAYHTLFLVEVESLDPPTAKKILTFVKNGGRVFCIETLPEASLGYPDFEKKNAAVRLILDELKKDTTHFILLKKPEKNFTQWYKQVQDQYHITPYLKINNGNSFVTQVRYQTADKEILIISNSNYQNTYSIQLTPDKKLSADKNGYVWDAHTGNRYVLQNETLIELTLYPADLRIIVFEKENNKTLPQFKEYPPLPKQTLNINAGWKATFYHIDGSTKQTSLEILKDLKDMLDFVHFSGTVVYQNHFNAAANLYSFIDLGVVEGVSALKINGIPLGVQWYGRHIYSIKDALQPSENTIEIAVTCTMGNYLKILKDNRIAQYWTNEKRKNQPLQSMGLIGPVGIF
jgi:hypothetical protein